MVCVYVLVLLVVRIAGDLWSRHNTSQDHQFFLNVTSVSNNQCGLICQQFHSCSQFGFTDLFCYCLGSGSHPENRVYLKYYYKRNNVNIPQVNQAWVDDLVSKNYTIYNGTDFGVKMKYPVKAWEQAENDCLIDGGHLYMVNSPFKREILNQYLEDISFNVGDSFHVGLKKTNGSWMWFDGGEEVFYLLPEGQNENCARFDNNVHNITSTKCVNPYAHLCEVPINI